jgi:hypothetical protein
MAASPKIVLSRSQDISFNKLSLSQANVRRAKAGVSIEALAESIVRHSLLQSLTVRPVLDSDGQETGLFEVPVGGRRFRALELLVAQKRMSFAAERIAFGRHQGRRLRPAGHAPLKSAPSSYIVRPFGRIIFGGRHGLCRRHAEADRGRRGCAGGAAGCQPGDR